MSVHHSPSKSGSLGVSRRLSRTSQTTGTPKRFLDEATIAPLGFQTLVINFKLPSWLATDAIAR